MRQFDINAILAIVAYAGYLACMQYMTRHVSRIERPTTQSQRCNGNQVRRELMAQLEAHYNARSVIRMSYDAFTRLVAILRGRGLLRDNQYSFVEEQVAKFLHILSGQGRVRSESFFFRRSTETISRHFHKVLRALITLQDQFLVQPNGSTVSPQILNSGGRFYPYFKNCIGAIDGTHIRVKVSKEDVSRYRGRKNYPTMNVLAACTFDLKFTYILPGWEGSASDSRILDNALSREDNLNAPQGKFYLADAGYMLRSTFLTPYRSTRYHLKEYSRHPPENPKELFNLRHSSLRNAIERAFGVLKNRFPILAEMSRYDVETVSEIVLGCCILHNFLVDFDPDEEIIAQVDRDLMNNEPDHGLANGAIARGEDGRRGEILRDSIAAQMWNDYITRH
ncbi:protein ALP1-like [Zingiber officinale]|uniref:DDE Tnp4 domain-containing protein n=1 Tax=Zingiber officinale TaxID=94328 RepID=A0A8J5F153_ZINOF|nr:protein ALP1-like [Zingiber officinale]KAG6476907.1 hypothetical protein ZIOFF_066155 [Zingiber officinale]